MKSGLDQLVKYAEYHRDRRNIATHLAGVPMIVFAAGLRQDLLKAIEARVGPACIRGVNNPAT